MERNAAVRNGNFIMSWHVFDSVLIRDMVNLKLVYFEASFIHNRYVVSYIYLTSAQPKGGHRRFHTKGPGRGRRMEGYYDHNQTHPLLSRLLHSFVIIMKKARGERETRNRKSPRPLLLCRSNNLAATLSRKRTQHLVSPSPLLCDFFFLFPPRMHPSVAGHEIRNILDRKTKERKE